MSMQERPMPGVLDRMPPSTLYGKERPQTLGVVVLIVAIDPKRNGENGTDPLIWTITELKDKPETDRVALQTSVPAETRKDGEDADNNVLGALAEFCNDEAFSSYVKKHLFKMPDKWYREKGITVGAHPADVAVVIYDGALDFSFKPTNSDEVKPNGWRKKSELKADPTLRSVVRRALELDDREQLTRRALDAYFKDPETKQLVFPESVDSIEEFSIIREYGIDVRVWGAWGLELFQKLPEARGLIMGAIGLLKEFQSQAKRDYEKEERIAVFLRKTIEDMRVMYYKVGLREVDGLGIKKVRALRSMRNGKPAFSEDSDAYKLEDTESSIQESYGYWILERGDRLGYPEELGKDWYLVFGRKGGVHIAVAPIKGIKNLELGVWDWGGL